MSTIMTAPDVQTAVRLANYLKGLGNHIESAVPVNVQIHRDSWVGALYCQTDRFGSQERAVTEGPMRTNELRRSYRLYLLGERYRHRRCSGNWIAQYDLPAARRRPLERCYAPTDEWYLGCYWERRPDMNEQQLESAPFGDMFMLILHQMMNFGCYKDWAVDTGELKPYVRLPMTVQYL